MTLAIDDLVKTFGEVKAVDHVSFEVEEGAFVCFLGPSGCGKTTLLRIIAGLEQADTGAVRLGGVDMSGVPARKRNFGVVFQSYSLFPNMSAQRNVGYGLECRGWSKSERQKRACEMLDLVGLADQARKLPSEMSGGQQQRVALARALAPNPSLLLLDEPLSALDAKVRDTLRQEIRSLQQRLGITTVMVTHDQDEALAMADTIVVLNGGKIEQIGHPRDLYTRPASAFVAGFIGHMNVLPVTRNGSGFHFSNTILDVDEADPGQGDIRSLGIRPEAIEVASSHGANAPRNVVPGEVRAVTFLGNLTRIEVAPDAQKDTVLTLELHGACDIPKLGDGLSLRLPSHALKVLP
ncbi:ABC transporter ATP-binding protein [Fulvimarina endophytica]|uniref:ABC transporter ATP-binding protein n=1 Tax=Fulvimarina endophytica TaxID=2293836 RepID=UPI0018F2D76F|nr:ATP-binding cassette domain-containing protein [Fulvimarina endophytica]